MSPKIYCTILGIPFLVYFPWAWGCLRINTNQFSPFCRTHSFSIQITGIKIVGRSISNPVPAPDHSCFIYPCIPLQPTSVRPAAGNIDCRTDFVISHKCPHSRLLVALPSLVSLLNSAFFPLSSYASSLLLRAIEERAQASLPPVDRHQARPLTKPRVLVVCTCGTNDFCRT